MDYNVRGVSIIFVDLSSLLIRLAGIGCLVMAILALNTCQFMHGHIYLEMQILPINIKGLAGSVATLANWFTAWVVTMTANLLLEWSSGGLFLFLSNLY